jgi:predicted nucleic acid-binding protein
MRRSLVLDSTVISEILRNNPRVCRRFWEETGREITVLMSPMVYFEVRRGLLKLKSQRLLQKLEELIAPFLWIDATRGDWETAASLWAHTRSHGHVVDDGDLIIAAQANRRAAVVVTDNVGHFEGVADEVEKWS